MIKTAIKTILFILQITSFIIFVSYLFGFGFTFGKHDAYKLSGWVVDPAITVVVPTKDLLTNKK